MRSRPKGYVSRLSSFVANDSSWSDYDLWRALKSINQELYRLERSGFPIPINLLYTRQIISSARLKREGAQA